MRALLLGVLLASLCAASASAQSWGPHERSIAIGRYDDFYVLRGSNSCSVKQSYYDNPSRMELVYTRGGGLVLITPFSRTPDQLVYEVDPSDLVPRHALPGSYFRSSNVIGLPRSLIAEMRRGRTLKVMVQINGQWSHVQTFSLMGFTAALNRLSQAPCS